MADRKPVEIILSRDVALAVSADGLSAKAVAITSAKARGLLAVLATAPDMTRSRKWVQSTLWSDRATQQASGSLRQEVRNLARLAPELSEALVSTRTTISLDRNKVHVRVGTGDANTNDKLLEELIIRDPVFTDWLEKERHARQPKRLISLPQPVMPQNRPQERLVCFQTTARADQETAFLETTLEHFLSRGLRESLHVDVIDETYARGRDNVTWIEIHSAPKGDSAVIIRVSVRDGPRKLLIWSDIGELPRSLALEIGSAELLSFCNRIVRGVLDELCLRGDSERGVGEAAMMSHLSIRKLFSMEPDQMREADNLFDYANQKMPHGVYLAWRAILRSFQRIERHEGLDAEQLKQETVELCRLALQQDPHNSLVLALASNALVALGENIESCADMARHSTELNPSNPFAWDSLSIVELYAGRWDHAHELAIKAADISRGAHHSFWWATGLAVSATSLGHLDQAIAHAEKAHAQSPKFRPPLRYLTALYAYNDQQDQAVNIARKLKQLEPSFTIERLFEDRDYPASMLSVGGLLNVEKLRELS